MKPKVNVKTTVVRMLAMREQASYDVRMKLKMKGYTQTEIDETVEWAVDNKYLSDERYAILYVQDAVNCKKHGKRRIFIDLKQKRIDEGIINNAIAEFFDDESSVYELVDLVERRLNGDFEQKNRDRTYRYFLTRGYEFSDIKKAVEKAMDNEE